MFGQMQILATHQTGSVAPQTRFDTRANSRNSERLGQNVGAAKRAAFDRLVGAELCRSPRGIVG